ncbi:MAG: glycosyltransferase [Deltaproteobacteria bacterium]|nr:glycosyltransferase [Deltaproteobacteria bacterium]
MKISIITVAYNNKETIGNAIDSVLSQDYDDLEYVIVDGASTDGTVEVIKEAVKRYSERSVKCVSEKDDGIYDAMNKGIRLAAGNIIGILNSDDFYINNNVISTVVTEFITKKVDSIFADLVYVRADDLDKIVRYYSSAIFRPEKMAYGWMPAHPTFFVKRQVYERYGLYKTDYIIAADYELIARLLVKNEVTYSYIPKVLVKMRTGGASTRNLKSNWILNKEILRACAENGIKTNIVKVLSKYPTKILQSIKKPK